jgi:type IV pilus assembly protein PilY1
VPVIKDVAVTVKGTVSGYPYVFERKASPDATQNEKHSFRTIMVQGYGSKMGAYFALDVTKPTIDAANPTTTGPKFLWQLSTDAAGNQLFGKGTATPLITSVYMDTKVATEPVRLVDVAVLPGGTGDSPSATVCPGSAANDVASAIPTDSSQSFRTGLRCYDVNGTSKNSIAARSLTIVRLDNGQIIRTFRPATVAQPVTFPTGANSILTTKALDENGTPHDLDIAAPIIGQPVAYPAGTGLPADRIFVGDAEGRLWRVDLSNPDTSKWSMNLFFDPYDANRRPIGQPIQTPPVLSVDSRGQITVAFSTGDQDNLTPDPNQASPVTFNYVASLTERATTDSGGITRFHANLNWQQEFGGGKRVLGPMTLFNRTLYFSTFMQTISPTCSDIGTSSVWGLDYLLSTPSNPTPLPKQNRPTIDYANVVVSGVGLRQRPSCSTVGSAVDATTTDAILGYGTITSVSATKAGAFELVIQKGGGRAATGAGASTSSNTIAQDTVAIEAPRAAARLDSWAPIIE